MYLLEGSNSLLFLPGAEFIPLTVPYPLIRTREQPMSANAACVGHAGESRLGGHQRQPPNCCLYFPCQSVAVSGHRDGFMAMAHGEPHPKLQVLRMNAGGTGTFSKLFFEKVLPSACTAHEPFFSLLVPPATPLPTKLPHFCHFLVLQLP